MRYKKEEEEEEEGVKAEKRGKPAPPRDAKH